MACQRLVFSGNDVLPFQAILQDSMKRVDQENMKVVLRGIGPGNHRGGWKDGHLRGLDGHSATVGQFGQQSGRKDPSCRRSLKECRTIKILPRRWLPRRRPRTAFPSSSSGRPLSGETATVAGMTNGRFPEDRPDGPSFWQKGDGSGRRTEDKRPVFRGEEGADHRPRFAEMIKK